jgi:hypothetical protein
MKESTRIRLAAQSLFAASNFNDFTLQSTVAQPANEHISAMLFDSELYQQYQQGLISAYEYAINVHRIVLEIEQAIGQCRYREEEAKKDLQRRVAAQQAEKLPDLPEVIVVKL